MTRTTSNLKRAVLELGINVPVYRTESGPNGVIILYCYGGTRHEWDPEDNTDPERAVASNGDKDGADVADRRHHTGEPDDLTQIPHVGPVTARELHNAGFHTFQDLNAATDAQLSALNNVTTVTLTYIRTFLTERNIP